MKIIYSDNDIIVCVKPYGVLSQEGEQNNMVSMLKDKFNCEIYPLHRLDKTTGGVMVFACNTVAAAKLSKQIVERSFKKQYMAIVHGEVTESTATLCDLLFFDRKKNKSYVVRRQRIGVKKAELKYTALGTGYIDGLTCSLLSIELMTGRTHQIRVQFASRNMPLVGDSRYGAKDNKTKISLWSHKISFIHPVTREILEFAIEPQDEFFNGYIAKSSSH